EARIVIGGPGFANAVNNNLIDMVRGPAVARINAIPTMAFQRHISDVDENSDVTASVIVHDATEAIHPIDVADFDCGELPQSCPDADCGNLSGGSRSVDDKSLYLSEIAFNKDGRNS